MRIGLLKEFNNCESRVAIVPNDIKKLKALDYEIYVESRAGENALFHNEDYASAGAVICERSRIFKLVDIIVGIEAPQAKEIKKLQKFSTVVSVYPSSQNCCDILEKNELTYLSMNLMPRLSNLQNMDINSSQDMLGGYAAVYKAAEHLQKVIPLTITAAGSVPPAVFLVIGVGVFGMSALSTAKRLGASVYAYDINPKAAELAKSVGAKFIDLSSKEAIEEFLPKVDVLICSAFSHNKKAPIIISKEQLNLLPCGAIVVDAATEEGGNIEGSKIDGERAINGITVFGYKNWAAKVPNSASIMLSKNISNLISEYFKSGRPDYTSEIIKEICVCKNGRMSK